MADAVGVANGQPVKCSTAIKIYLFVDLNGVGKFPAKSVVYGAYGLDFWHPSQLFKNSWIS